MSERITCTRCGASYDPARLDDVLFHENITHRPIKAAGIIGERVPDSAENPTLTEK